MRKTLYSIPFIKSILGKNTMNIILAVTKNIEIMLHMLN